MSTGDVLRNLPVIYNGDVTGKPTAAPHAVVVPIHLMNAVLDVIYAAEDLSQSVGVINTTGQLDQALARLSAADTPSEGTP